MLRPYNNVCSLPRHSAGGLQSALAIGQMNNDFVNASLFGRWPELPKLVWGLLQLRNELDPAQAILGD